MRWFKRMWRREPVRVFTGLQGTVTLATQGLVLFDAWDPTVDQLAYVNGLVAAVALAWGFTGVRNRVSPLADDQ